MGSFQPRYRGLGELLTSPGMVLGMRELAEKGKTAAEAISPVGPADDPHRGAYKAAWEVSSGIREGPTRRAYGRISNPLDYAASVEFGNARTRKDGTVVLVDGQYVLTIALDAIRE